MMEALAVAAVLHGTDPVERAIMYHRSLDAVVRQVEEQEAAELAAERAQEAADAVSRGNGRSAPAGALPPLLALIRSEESGGGTPGSYDYSAYNGDGCEGYGCGGAYQLHALYAPTWASRAGYPGMSPNAATWPPQVQDAVALDLFYSTNPDGTHWCRWTDYC